MALSKVTKTIASATGTPANAAADLDSQITTLEATAGFQAGSLAILGYTAVGTATSCSVIATVSYQLLS